MEDTKKDSQIIEKSYKKILQSAQTKKARKGISHDVDVENADRIRVKIMRLSVYLIEFTSQTFTENQQHVREFKKAFVEYRGILNRHPDLIPGGLREKMSNLISAVALHEAVGVSNMKKQYPRGECIDISRIFDTGKLYTRLTREFAADIVKEALKDHKDTIGNKETLYITATGDRYHRYDCPFCRGKKLLPISMSLLEHQRFTPCRCLTKQQDENGIDKNVTVFIDESIYQLDQIFTGNNSGVSTFGYIICRGMITSEDQISEENIILTGIDYCDEEKRTTIVTENAIGKVLITLAFGLKIANHVHIKVDNRTVLGTWMNNEISKQMLSMFESVTLEYIPREMNTKADKLTREDLFMKISRQTYRDLVKAAKSAEALTNDIKIQMEKNSGLSQEIERLYRELYSYRKNHFKYLVQEWEGEHF